MWCVWIRLRLTRAGFIRTRDGREVLCDGKPLLQESTGYYRYRTRENRDAVIRKDDVAAIVKRNA